MLSCRFIHFSSCDRCEKPLTWIRAPRQFSAFYLEPSISALFCYLQPPPPCALTTPVQPKKTSRASADICDNPAIYEFSSELSSMAICRLNGSPMKFRLKNSHPCPRN